MKWIVSVLLLVSVGCTTAKSIPHVDTKSQDVAFELALKEAVTNSHKEEMEALSAQTEILNRIEESVASLKPSGTSVEASEPQKATDTLETEESVPSDALEPQKVEESTEETEEIPQKDEEDEKPTLYVTFADFHCPPCITLGEDIDKGLLDKFEIVISTDTEGLRSDRPVIRFEWPTSPSGYGIIYGYDKQIREWLLRNVPAAPKAAGVGDTIISFSNPPPHPTPLKYSTSSTRSGVRWNWNGSWNVSNQYAEDHLRQAHGIEAAGLPMNELERLHDDAHNGVAQVKVRYSVTTPMMTSQPVRYSSPVKVQSTYRSAPNRRTFRYRSSCPGGNCP